MTCTRFAWRGIGIFLVGTAFLLAAAHASSDGDRGDKQQNNQRGDEDQDQGKGKSKGKGKGKGKSEKNDPNIVTVDLSKLPKDLAKELKRHLDKQDEPKKKKGKDEPSSNTRDIERRLDNLAREIEDLRKALRSQGGGDEPKKKKKKDGDD